MHTADRDDHLLIASSQEKRPSREDFDRERSNTDRQVEAVVVRDPDGAVDVRVFIDGVETPVTELTIDAGAGWSWADWKRSRDRNLSAASPSAGQVLLAAYADPAGGRYVADRGETQWLDGVLSTPTTDEDQR